MGENDLKEQCEKAEEIYLRAKRRAGWIERRMYDAPTEELFTMLAAELEKQEKLVNTLAAAALSARYKYLASKGGVL